MNIGIKLRETKTSILNTEGSGLKLVLNVCNTKGDTNYKIVEVFDKRWKRAKEEMRGWFVNQQNYKKGNVNTTAVQSDVWIVNMLCQDNDKKNDGEALKECIQKVLKMAKYEKASVHVSKLIQDELPDLTKKFLEDTFVANGVNVCVYLES
ncbi:MAG: hypothetical protein LC122_13400 [Chitinophagales bacterium]|nr:hypothetical protein [Chitinophagales bacterium]